MNDFARPAAMIKPLVIMCIVVAVVLGGIYAWQTFIGHMTKKYMSGAATAPQTVSTAVATALPWQARAQSLGTLRAVRGADLAAQASGVVDKIRFESGGEVRAGTTLVTLKANEDPAKLAQLRAGAELASLNYERDQEQLAAQAISRATVDADRALLKSARAQVSAQLALIEEKTIKAPFSGRLGIRQIDEGQYLSAGTPVVTLQALDPIFVDFYMPQQALARLQVGQSVAAAVDAYPGSRFTGQIDAINAKVDAASRNVQVRASLRNRDRRLVPGMYANVEVDDGDASVQVTLPQSAITYNAYGDTVFVVQQRGVDDKGNPRSVVQQRFVKLGATRGDQVAIQSGVAAGEVVVTAGQMKLRNNAPIVVNNKIMPSNDSSPAPANE